MRSLNRGHRIFEVTSVGAIKAEILAKLPSLTTSQLRKIAAELADKDYLRPDPNDNNLYVTMHKGHIFLSKFRGLEE